MSIEGISMILFFLLQSQLFHLLVEENGKLIEMKKEQKIYEDVKRLIEIDEDEEEHIHEEIRDR